MKLSIEQHFMTPFELANSLPKKLKQPSPSSIQVESSSNDFPLGKVLFWTGVTIGVFYIGKKIYDQIQEDKKRRDHLI
jgi:hypothetical protein